MFADKKTCEHEFLVEVRRVIGTTNIAFNRETNQTEDTQFEHRIFGKPRKYCHCENCGKKFPNPRWSNNQ